jgi:hypothetical protein
MLPFYMYILELSTPNYIFEIELFAANVFYMKSSGAIGGPKVC